MNKLQTKVVWSMEAPFTDLKGGVSLKNAEFDALRLIYSEEGSEKIAEFLQNATQKLHNDTKPPAILVDFSEVDRITVSAVGEHAEFVYDSIVKIGSADAKKADIRVTCQKWEKTFTPDATVYIGFGDLVLKILEVKAKSFKAKVVQGGTIKEGMDVYVEETRKNPTLFDLSKINVNLFKDTEIDYVILPGISNPREIALIRKKIELELKVAPWLILRVDNSQAYSNIQALLPHVDGIMISRRELALSLDPALVPIASKEMIHACHEKAKMVMIASDMLGSMRYNATPTRAEVSDVANAVIDGTDAVVLAEDLSLGPYAERSLSLCKHIIRDIEDQENIHINWYQKDFVATNEFDAVAFHAYKTAQRVKAKAIVCITKHGNTAVRLASFQVPIPIIAVTFSQRTHRRLSLVRGVTSLLLDTSPNLDEVLPIVSERLLKNDWLKAGDSIVFVTVSLSSIAYEASNLFTIQQLG
ncbi:MAG: hypothetical protein HYW48_11250 [Deltaproteobacteria bacterium]|nr:hypothetical protein [Deltaproteobacteria bacterium]